MTNSNKNENYERPMCAEARAAFIVCKKARDAARKSSKAHAKASDAAIKVTARFHAARLAHIKATIKIRELEVSAIADAIQVRNACAAFKAADAVT